MRKPYDIPQDVWATVERTFYNGMDIGIAGAAIARLIVAEREACAQIAETETAETSNTRDVDVLLQELAEIAAGNRIAAAIRKRGEP